MSVRYRGVITSWGRDSDTGVIRADFGEDFPVRGRSLRTNESDAWVAGAGDRVSFVLAVAENGAIECRQVGLVE